MLTVLFAVDNGYYLWFWFLVRCKVIFCSLCVLFFVDFWVLFLSTLWFFFSHSMTFFVPTMVFCSRSFLCPPMYFLFTLWLFFVHSIARTLQCTFCSLYGSFLYHPMYFLFTIWLFLVQAMIIFGLLLVFIINYIPFILFTIVVRVPRTL